jgi:broad specificity phosphatase PhoE
MALGRYGFKDVLTFFQPYSSRCPAAADLLMTPKLPQILWVVRHGQSAGNVARDAAEAGGLHVIDIATRDIDVPLSALGRRQSESLGHWFGSLPAPERPQVLLCSPYVRAGETARLLLDSAGITGSVTLRMDERLREKEFGILDRLTKLGITDKYPELSEQRAHVGKFYFRPPGGESWCDVILRLRSLLEMTTREYAGQRVLVVAHQVIVNCMRYLVEQMDEATILGIDRLGDIPNCSVTSYCAQGEDDGNDEPRYRLDLVNFLAPLLEEGTPVTTEPDAPVAPNA